MSEPSAAVDRVAYAVIGAAIEVHRHLGPGLLEAAYEAALVMELELRTIRVRRQIPIPIVYKGRTVAQGRIDLLVEELLIVEIKSIESLSAIHRAQVVSYLRASHLELGLLINFNVDILKHGLRRVVPNASALVLGGLRLIELIFL